MSKINKKILKKSFWAGLSRTMGVGLGLGLGLGLGSGASEEVNALFRHVFGNKISDLVLAILVFVIGFSFIWMAEYNRESN